VANLVVPECIKEYSQNQSFRHDLFL
jgi:hypothetical protein